MFSKYFTSAYYSNNKHNWPEIIVNNQAVPHVGICDNAELKYMLCKKELKSMNYKIDFNEITPDFYTQTNYNGCYFKYTVFFYDIRKLQ